jgi:hypothetical protein
MKTSILFTVITCLIIVSATGVSQQQNNFGDDNEFNLNFPNSIWDVQLAINLSSGFGAEFDGYFFYVTDGFSNLINKYDISGNLIEVFSITGVSGLDDLAYDGVYMYGGTGSTNIFQMDFTSHSLVGTIATPFSVRHIAYDENYDAFWIGSWSSPLALISRTGTVLNIFNILLPTITGTAYDNVSPGGPYLWFFDRGDTSPGPQLIKQFHTNSGTFTGVTHDVLSDVGIGQPNAIAGGLFSTADLVQGTFSLGGILVGSPTILFAYEILNPIPVELISFTADYYDGNVFLIWETASEINNKGFEIQRLQDRNNSELLDLPAGEAGWYTIGFVEGNGTTTQPHTYNFSYEQNVSGIYLYRLKQIDFDGTFMFSQVVEVKIPVPEEIKLEQNYPNPFNPSTKIKFTIPSVIATPLERGKQSQFISLKVYDVLGNEIAILVNEEKPAGSYEVEFNIHSDEGQNLPSGVYFYQLRSGGLETSSGQGFIQTKKMILMK